MKTLDTIFGVRSFAEPIVLAVLIRTLADRARPSLAVPRKPTSAVASDTGSSVPKEGVGVGDAPKASNRS